MFYMMHEKRSDVFCSCYFFEKKRVLVADFTHTHTSPGVGDGVDAAGCVTVCEIPELTDFYTFVKVRKCLFSALEAGQKGLAKRKQR